MAGVFITVTVVPSDLSPGLSVLLSSGSSSVVLTADSEGAVSTPLFHIGDTISVTADDGHVALSQSFVVLPDRTDYVVGPLVRSNADSVAGVIPATEIAGQPNVQSPVKDNGLDVLPKTLLRPTDSYEYIYPSGAFGKYFTSSQARMYIGDLFVDELNTVQFTLQSNRIPIYGYASRDFDDMAIGRSLIQGQIFINFISEGYLFTIIKEHGKLTKGQSQDPKQDRLLQAQQEFQDLRNAHLILASARAGRPAVGSNPDGSPVNQAIKDNRLQLVEQRMGQIAALGPDVIDKGRFFQPLPSIYANAAYHTNPFDIEIELEGAGRVVKRRLERCYLISNDYVMAPDDKVIGESYSFLARRLR